MPEDHDDTLAEAWYARKSALMEQWLGKEHDMVMHSMIPYGLGGGLDLDYFPHDIPGTAIATKELCELPGAGSSNAVFATYELVMFTRYPLALDDAQDETTDFGKAHRVIKAILSCMAPYSAEATLNPYETCEFPADMETVGGKCLIFDAYGLEAEHADFGLLAIIEIHRSEMDYAREFGGRDLLEKLKDAGYYPYSDLARPAVV